MKPEIAFEVLTIFPQMIIDFSKFGIICRAAESGLVSIRAHDIRDFAADKHRQVDDYPYGGGAGMVMKPEPIMNCLDNTKNLLGKAGRKPRIVLLSPQGVLFNQTIAKEFAKSDSLVLICGRYEGVDARIEENIATDVVSIGDFILTGGEAAAIVVIEAVSRLVPGVLGDEQSSLDETFEQGLLEYPQYTRPEQFRGLKVPSVLLSGDHKRIGEWRRRQSLLRTAHRRSDLLRRADLSKEDLMFLSELSTK